MGNPSQSCGSWLTVWDHPVLPATRRKWMRPDSQAGTRFTYPGGMEGWVDLGSLLAARAGIEPTTLDCKSDALTVTPPSHPVDLNPKPLLRMPLLINYCTFPERWEYWVDRVGVAWHYHHQHHQFIWWQRKTKDNKMQYNINIITVNRDTKVWLH